MHKILKPYITLFSLVLIIGLFLPLTKLPIYGQVSYYRIASIESYCVMLFALSAPIFLHIKKYKLIIISITGVWLCLIFPAIEGYIKYYNSGLFGKIGHGTSNTMKEFAVKLFLNIEKFSWGGFIFMFAVLAFTLCCILCLSKK